MISLRSRARRASIRRRSLARRTHSSRRRPTHSHSRGRMQRPSRATKVLVNTSDGGIDWKHANQVLESGTLDKKQKTEILRTSIIYQNLPMIKKLLKQGIKPMKSFYKYIEKTPKGEQIMELLDSSQ